MACDYYLKAANQGNHFAQASMGFLYYKGLGVPKDLEQALSWYRKAAAQGHATAIKRVDAIERELANQRRLSQMSYQGDFPLPAFIGGNKVNVRNSPSTEAYSVNKLNSGHPVSVSRRSTQSDGDWFYVRTASGTQGWVRSDFITLSDNMSRTNTEIANRRYSLPARGAVVGNNLNLRNIPALRSSSVITEITAGTEITAFEIFAEEERDWYRIRTEYGEEGWVSGRYIELR